MRKREVALACALVSVTGCRIHFDPLEATDASSDATAAPDATEPSGLVLHFAFESDGLNHDRSSGHHDASCAPTCPTTTAGRVGSGAASFGAGSCLQIQDAADLRPTMFTYTLWLQPAAASAQPQSAFGRAFNGATAGTNTFEVFVGAFDVWKVAVNTMSTSSNLDHGVWRHVAGVFDGNALVMYVDGVQSGAPLVTGAATYAADTLQIGCDLNSGTLSNPFTGLIDEVRLYDHPLTAVEIAALAGL